MNGISEEKCLKMVLGEARGKQTSNLILKVSLLAKKSDVWNIWEPWAVEKFHEKYLNFCETLTRNIKCNWVCLRSENKVP